MSGRIQTLSGKRRPQKKAAGKKPNAHRQRVLASRKRKYRSSALFAKREALKEAQAARASEVPSVGDQQ
ncbi:MAG: hypothetical protein E1N59_1248 [Puniceicoccaceae bacterium 5H]|nr:MAG: hypothetical protein E1N59_1248 [Puniceicoccaceae bacterium 5H]